MKKRILFLFGLILSIVLLIAIVLGVMYFPRSIKSFIGVDYDEIEEIHIEAGYDIVKVYSLRDDDKKTFYDKISKIKVMPTYTHIKAISTIQFVIKTKEKTIIFCEFYSKTASSNRKEFNLLDKKEYETLFSLFPNFNINEYNKLN